MNLFATRKLIAGYRYNDPGTIDPSSANRENIAIKLGLCYHNSKRMLIE